MAINMAVKISSVEGNRQWLDGGSMFGNAPRPVWEKWIQPDSIGRIPLACRCLLIEVDDKKILCETGIGAFFDPRLADRFGVEHSDRHLLRENLNSLGIQEDEIDLVILSHLHFDHAGGLLPTWQESNSGNNNLLFPNAKYLVGKDAWQRAEHPHGRDRSSFIPGLTEKLKESNRLVIVDSDRVPGLFDDKLSFFVSNGHTPGQMHTVFKGAKSSVVFAGDLIPGQSWVHLPITMGYDRYPELLIDEKADLYKRAVPEHWLIFYTHDSKFSASNVTRSDSGRFVPENSIETLQHFEI